MSNVKRIDIENTVVFIAISLKNGHKTQKNLKNALKVLMSTTPSIPRRSPIQVLTRLDVA